MLKWAVTGQHRQQQSQNSCNPEITGVNQANKCYQRRSVSNAGDVCSTRRNNRPPRRKSTGYDLGNIKHKVIQRDKENSTLTSTPLNLSSRATISPLRRIASLKDLSNITTTPSRTVPNSLLTPQISKDTPLQYASTLPTFDVEYSPCGIIPGPILALRGVGIADSYFDKPRYFAENKPEIDKKVSPPATEVRNVNTKHKRRHSFRVNPINPEQESSLSSSRMGDTTLNKMIDAILESAKKERRSAKMKQISLGVMSSTYTPADDPASDLNELWDQHSTRHLQCINENESFQMPSIDVFNEREVKTPDRFDESIDACVELPAIEKDTCHLRRQKAVRRKRKLSITSTVKNSAQKLFANSSFKRRNMDTPKEWMNTSPDSGRNSLSDLEDPAEEMHFTKRRLSFSPVKSKIPKHE